MPWLPNPPLLYNPVRAALPPPYTCVARAACSPTMAEDSAGPWPQEAHPELGTGLNLHGLVGRMGNGWNRFNLSVSGVAT